jgi:hypothetical protein
LSLVSRIRTAAALPPSELALALRATLGLARARAEIAFAGFERIRRVLGQPDGTASRDVARARAVRRAVERAARTLPGSGCLPRAIVAARMLRNAGVGAEVVIGAERRDGAAPVGAHAWVRVGDFIVTGEDEAERFVEMTSSPVGS